VLTASVIKYLECRGRHGPYSLQLQVPKDIGIALLITKAAGLQLPVAIIDHSYQLTNLQIFWDSPYKRLYTGCIDLIHIQISTVWSEQRVN
jgi:hypothetical protein